MYDSAAVFVFVLCLSICVNVATYVLVLLSIYCSRVLVLNSAVYEYYLGCLLYSPFPLNYLLMTQPIDNSSYAKVMVATL